MTNTCVGPITFRKTLRPHGRLLWGRTITEQRQRQPQVGRKATRQDGKLPCVRQPACIPASVGVRAGRVDRQNVFKYKGKSYSLLESRVRGTATKQP